MSLSCFTVGASDMMYDVIIQTYHRIMRFNNKIFIANRIFVLDKSFTFHARNIVDT